MMRATSGWRTTSCAPNCVNAMPRTPARMRRASMRPLFCPRCRHVLARTIDRVKTGTFNYFRCAGGHGRFITFGQFMTEKGFVRMLTPVEINKISESVKTVRCTGCGARTSRRCSVP